MGRFRKTVYTYNEDVFLNENELSYYLLGVFLTDGCINKRSDCDSYRGSLALKDEVWLKDIAYMISSDHPTSTDKRTGCFTFQFNNQKILRWLLQNECVPQKTLIVKFPQINNKFVPDLLRGIIDGDGSIDVNKASVRIVSASFIFLDSISKFLIKNEINNYIKDIKQIIGNIKGKPIIPKNKLYSLNCYNTNAAKFFKLIKYDDEFSFSLERKRERAIKIINKYIK